MERKVFVIHHSEIVRRGIIAILRNYFNLEYLSLGSINELKSFEQIENNQLVIFIEYADVVDQSSLFHLQQKNQVKTVGVCDKEIVSKNVLGFNHCISLNIKAKEMESIVSEYLNQTENNKTEKHEGEELSRREKDVLQLVALGNTNKEIADKLFISIHTVITHRKNITEKLGIKSISGLTVYAIINKLIDTETIDPEQLI